MNIVDQLVTEEERGPHANTLTAEALINILSEVSPDTPVYYGYGSGDHWRTQIAGAIHNVSLKRVEHSGYHDKMTIASSDDDEDDSGEPQPGQVLILSP